MRKAISTILLVLLAVVLLVLGFVIVIATTPIGERFVTSQVNNYLAKKIKSPFRIGRISYKIPDYIELNDVFFQTPKGDTLLMGQRLFVDLDMLGLLNNRVAINQIDLEKVRLNITRTLPDTAFNFNYILDAFVTPGQPQPDPVPLDTTTAPLDINLKAISFKDVRVKYLDDVTGSDVNAYVDTLRANFEKTDISNNIYRLQDLTVDGLDARARIYKGLPTPDSPPSPDTLDIGLGKWTLNRARWDVNLEEQKMTTKGQLQSLAMDTDYFFYNSERFGVKSLVLAGANILYDDLTQPKLRTGLDYAHLDLQDFAFTGEQLRYDPRQMSGKLRQARVRDKSGFVLQRLDGDLVYTDKTTSLTNLWIQTPKTLLRDQVVLKYDSIAQLSNPRQARRVGVSVNLRQSVLALSDVLLLAPQLAGTLKNNQAASIRMNARAEGTLASLNLPVLDIAALSGTRVRARGRLTNVTDPDRIGLDLIITEATTRLADIRRVVPANTLPDAIDIPPQIRLTGRVRGLLNDLDLQTRLATTWGNATFDGQLKGFVEGRNQAYSGTLALSDFRAEKWLKDAKTYGPVTAIATVNGNGIDPKTMNTSFRVNVDEATLLGYRYQNIVASGQLVRGQLAVKGVSDDPNARLQLDTRVGLSGEYPSIVGTVDIGQLNLSKLKLYNEPLELKGKIVLDMTSTDPARPIGTITTDDVVVRYNGQSYPLDAVSVKAAVDGNRKQISARTPFAQVNLDGQFAYDRLYDIVVAEFSKYFAVPGLTYRTTPPPYDFRFNAKLYQHPVLKVFVPGLTRLDTVRLAGYLDNTQDTTLAATLRTGIIEYDTTLVRNVNLTLRATSAGGIAISPTLPVGIAAPPQKGLAGTLGNLFNRSDLQPITFSRGQLLIQGLIESVTTSGIDIGQTRLTGAAANNRLSFQVVSKDSAARDVYGLAGQLAVQGQDYRVQLARNGLLLNYQNWTADTTGYVQYGPQGLYVNRLQLRHRDEYIEAASTETYANAPLRITIRNFQLADAARMANQDTTLASGQLDGTVVLRDYLGADSDLSFVGTVNIDSLRVMDKPIGNVNGRFTNQADGRVGINVALSGPDNQATVNGTYNGTNSGLDLTVELQKLAARTIEAFSFGELRRARGQLTGQFTVKGTTNDPKLNGQVNFDSVAVNIKQLNATYRIDQERLLLDGSTITLNNFTLADTLGRTLNTTGTVTLTNLPDASYNLTVQADDFLVLNAARKDNDYLYGKATATANLRIRGAGTKSSISGSVRIEDDSKVSFVLPDDTPELNDARQVVTFIDHKDTLALSKYLVKPKVDTVNTKIAFEKLDNATISLNIEVDEKSEFTIVVDELNGDYLRARGNANLNVTMDASGNMQILGRYEVTDGEYALTYEVLKRQFKIQKGSSITWTGDPLAAQVDITAIYEVRTAPANLVANEISGQNNALYQNKIPFNVLLKIGNNLAKPALSFDIVRPTTGNSNALAAGGVNQTVDNKLAVLRRDESQINKQVFALLVLGNFISENSSDFFSSGSGGSGAAAESIARNSVSKILSEQLERFASSLIKGVDVNFNLNSTNQAATANGPTGSRTDLNVGLSKSFLSGRLSVQVGRNFVLENNTGIQRNPNEVFDNFSLNYNLTRDGRYVVRGYRRNEQQSVLEGYIVETGVGFIITIDYNTLADLRRRRKEERPTADM